MRFTYQTVEGGSKSTAPGSRVAHIATAVTISAGYRVAPQTARFSVVLRCVASNSATGGKIVMVVEDNPADLLYAEHQLRRSKRVDAVLVATDGDRALDVLEALSTDGKSLPDVIFLDLQMPRMSGFEFLEEFEERFPGNTTRVVIVTGTATEPDRLRTLAHRSVVDCIAKPIVQRDFERLFRSESVHDVASFQPVSPTRSVS